MHPLTPYEREDAERMLYAESETTPSQPPFWKRALQCVKYGVAIAIASIIVVLIAVALEVAQIFSRNSDKE